MDSNPSNKPEGIQSTMCTSCSSTADEELEKLREKYNELNLQMDQILSETMERSSRIIMEAEIGNIIMRQVFDASNDGIWAVDRSFKIIRVNKKLLRFLGKPAEKVIGSRCHEFFGEACLNHEKCPAEKIFEGRAIVEQERTLTSASGKSIPFMVTSTPLSDLDGNVIGLVEAFTDITERKRAEQELQRANRELERLAIEDGLTQLPNRRRFDEYLNLEWRRQAREQNQISMILCDVDLFKKYNDTYGHQAGDACLISVAEAIKRSLRRPSDLAARYGGEEFAVIIPATDLRGALHVAERIRQELAAMQIPHSQSSVAPYVTISCGIATLFPTLSNKPRMLIEKADQGLYRAKQQGRNCVVLSED